MKQTYSAAHADFLKREKKKTVTIHVARLALLFFLLCLWELAALFHWVDPFITSSPSRIFKTIFSLSAGGDLLYHTWVTLSETLIGFFLSTLFGFAIALLLWWNATVRKILEPYIVVLNALPKVALGPLLIIWCGTGAKTILTMTVLICIVIATMNILNGFLSADEGKILLLRSMGASKFQILLKLILPASRSAFLSMLKINVGMAWIGSIMGEYIVSKAGLGYLIVYGGQVFKLDLVMSAIALLCVMATAMYAGIAALEKLLVKNGDKN